MARRFQLMVLSVGAGLTVLPFAFVLRQVPENELVYAVTSGAVGVLLLFSPYMALSSLGRDATPMARYGALAVLAVGTGLFFLLARDDAQGGLVAFYIVPAQWLVAALTRWRGFSPPPDVDPPSRYSDPF